MEDRAEMEEELLIGRESRASVDKSLERVRMSIQREFDDRKLEMMEVSKTQYLNGEDFVEFGVKTSEIIFS